MAPPWYGLCGAAWTKAWPPWYGLCGAAWAGEPIARPPWYGLRASDESSAMGVRASSNSAPPEVVRERLWGVGPAEDAMGVGAEEAKGSGSWLAAPMNESSQDMTSSSGGSIGESRCWSGVGLLAMGATGSNSMPASKSRRCSLLVAVKMDVVCSRSALSLPISARRGKAVERGKGDGENRRAAVGKKGNSLLQTLGQVLEN